MFTATVFISVKFTKFWIVKKVSENKWSSFEYENFE